MPMRHAGPATLTERRSSAQARHLRGEAGLINEGELRRVEIELTLEPGLPTPQNVGAVLLQCMCGLF